MKVEYEWYPPSDDFGLPPDRDTRIIACDACEGTGRELVYHSPAQGDVSPCNERDVGACAHCSGRGEVEVETQPVECDDGVTD